MLHAVLPAQEGVACAVSRVTQLTARLGNAGGLEPSRKRLASTWKSLLHNVSGRRTAGAMLATGGGGMLVRAMATAGDKGSAAGSAGAASPRVCILGGGFGGLYTAVKLESLLWPRGTKPQVTLIDQAERFTFKPLLYELLTGAATADEVAPPYSQLLAPYPVTFVRGKVASVRPDDAGGEGGSESGGTVVLDSGDAVPYDWLVLALGAETATFGVSGVKEYALPFSTYEDAARVIHQLETLAAGAAAPEIIVVGGGYAGVELAAAAAERLQGRGRIQLVTSALDILPASPEGQREAARRALQDDGISIVTGAAVKEIRAVGAEGSSSEAAKRMVYVNDVAGQTQVLGADLVLWAAGQAPAPRVEGDRMALPFPCDSRGATQTDATLRVLRNRRVFALGDVAVAGAAATSPPGEGGAASEASPRLPATAQVAFQQADYVAWNIWACLNDRPLLKFSYQHLGDMMSLGTLRGAVSLPIPVPPALSAAVGAGPLGDLLRVAGVRVSGSYGGASDGVTVEGPLAAALRRAAYLYRQPTDRQRLRVAASWAEQATSQLAQVARKVLAGSGTPPSGGSTS